MHRCNVWRGLVSSHSLVFQHRCWHFLWREKRVGEQKDGPPNFPYVLQSFQPEHYVYLHILELGLAYWAPYLCCLVHIAVLVIDITSLENLLCLQPLTITAAAKLLLLLWSIKQSLTPTQIQFIFTDYICKIIFSGVFWGLQPLPGKN